MSGLVAPAPTIPTEALTSGDWYPSIDPAAARSVMRLDGTVSEPRLVECLAIAMAEVEDQLDAWQQQQTDLGRASLADVPSKQIGGESRLVRLYRRAVYSSAQAELVERYADVGATADGRKRSEDLADTSDDYRRNLRYAIRGILGRPRGDVELL